MIQTAEFTTTLLRWFSRFGRELPWRNTRDPYAIWLSEIILQQTQVKQGWSYWERFMRQWPTVEALAAATEDEVLRLWQGLGYYSRARNLHAAARQIVALGGFPQTYEGLKQLKGVGPYTAAAIGSIAFDLPVAVVDGNVFRVLARHYGIATPINTTEGRHEFTALAQSLLPATSASAFNQAMMDFGATQCTPQSPRCADCPLQETCIAFREGRVGELPVKLKTLKVKERHLIYIYIRHNGQTAIRRRGSGDIWQGLWEPFLAADSQQQQPLQPPSDGTAVSSTCSEKTPPMTPPLKGGELRIICLNLRHVLTHRIILADFYLWQPMERPTLPDDYIWIPEADIDHYAIPRLIELLLQKLYISE